MFPIAFLLLLYEQEQGDRDVGRQRGICHVATTVSVHLACHRTSDVCFTVMPRPRRGKQAKSGLTQSFVSAAAVAASRWLILNEHGQGRPGAAVFGLILLQIARLWKAAQRNCRVLPLHPTSTYLKLPLPHDLELCSLTRCERVPVRAKRARLPFN